VLFACSPTALLGAVLFGGTALWLARTHDRIAALALASAGIALVPLAAAAGTLAKLRIDEVSLLQPILLGLAAAGVALARLSRRRRSARRRVRARHRPPRARDPAAPIHAPRGRARRDRAVRRRARVRRRCPDGAGRRGSRPRIAASRDVSDASPAVFAARSGG